MSPQWNHLRLQVRRCDLKTSCNVDYGGALIEQMLLGLAACRGLAKRQCPPA